MAMRSSSLCGRATMDSVPELQRLEPDARRLLRTLACAGDVGRHLHRVRRQHARHADAAEQAAAVQQATTTSEEIAATASETCSLTSASYFSRHSHSCRRLGRVLAIGQ